MLKRHTQYCWFSIVFSAIKSKPHTCCISQGLAGNHIHARLLYNCGQQQIIRSTRTACLFLGVWGVSDGPACSGVKMHCQGVLKPPNFFKQDQMIQVKKGNKKREGQSRIITREKSLYLRRMPHDHRGRPLQWFLPRWAGGWHSTTSGHTIQSCRFPWFSANLTWRQWWTKTTLPLLLVLGQTVFAGCYV